MTLWLIEVKTGKLLFYVVITFITKLDNSWLDGNIVTLHAIMCLPLMILREWPAITCNWAKSAVL